MKTKLYLILCVIITSCFNNNSQLIISPDQTVIKFLNWYNDHLNEFQNINFIKTSNDGYKIDSISVEKFLMKLKSSDLVSDNYIQWFKIYFKKCNDNFKKTKQNDGPPLGLDADLIMWSNSDYEKELLNLDKVQITEEYINNEKARIKLKFIGGREITYFLLKTDKWYIEEIRNINEL